jgi:hypothetical protein
MVERRRSRRAVPEKEITITVAGGRAARLVNISADGALLEVASALNPRAEYRLMLPLIDGTARIRARVVRCRMMSGSGSDGRPVYLAGLEFLDVDQKLATAIAFSFPPTVDRPARRGPIKVKIDVDRLEGGKHGPN